MIGYKFLIFTDGSHSADAIARSASEAVTRGCEGGSTDYWWAVLEKDDGLESALMIVDTEDDKENLTEGELAALEDIEDIDIYRNGI